MLNYESKNITGFRNFSLKATKKCKPLINFIFRLPIEVRMSGDSPPRFHPGHLEKKVLEGGEVGYGHGGRAIPRGGEVVGPGTGRAVLKTGNFGKVKNQCKDERGSTPPPSFTLVTWKEGLRRWQNRRR